MSEFHVTVYRVDEVTDHPDAELPHLSVVKVLGHTLIAGKMKDNIFRYGPGDLVIFIPVNAIIPLDLLKFQSFYWDAEKDRGLLKGGKRNRVGPVTRGSVTSDGIMFPVENQNEETGTGIFKFAEGYELEVREGDQIESLLGIDEYKP